MQFPLFKDKDGIKAPKFFEYLEQLKEGKYRAEIKRVAAKRTFPQNDLYHWWTRIVASELGYSDHEEVCRALKIKLGYCEIVNDPITKGKRYVCPSTADMNVPDMSEYMTKVEVFVTSELGIILPHGEEQP